MINASDRPDFKFFLKQYYNSALFKDSDLVLIIFTNHISFKDMTIILDHNTATFYGL